MLVHGHNGWPCRPLIDRIIQYGHVPAHGIVCGYKAIMDSSVDHSITPGRLTHCGLLCSNPCSVKISVNMVTGNGLFFDGTKPLPEPKLASQYHRIWGYPYKKRRLTSIGIRMLKVRGSHDRRIFIMIIPISEKEDIFSEMGFWFTWDNIYRSLNTVTT